MGVASVSFRFAFRFVSRFTNTRAKTSTALEFAVATSHKKISMKNILFVDQKLESAEAAKEVEKPSQSCLLISVPTLYQQ